MTNANKPQQATAAWILKIFPEPITSTMVYYYSCYLKRYDVYNLYNGSVYIKDIQYYRGLEAVNNVKKPKIINYSVDSLQVIGS